MTGWWQVICLVRVVKGEVFGFWVFYVFGLGLGVIPGIGRSETIGAGVVASVVT